MTDIVTGAVIAKIPERISASMAAKSAKRAAKKAAQDAAKAVRAAEKAEKAAQTVKVAKAAETVEKTEEAAKAVSAVERFYSELDALKLKAREIPHTLTTEEVRACEAVKLQMKGELSAAGKVSVEEVEKIDEAVKAASAAKKAKGVSEVGEKATNVRSKASVAPSVEAAKADFYVKPNGELVPSTGYRYMDSNNALEAIRDGKQYTTYFGVDKFDSAKDAQSAFQVSQRWSDCRVRGEFDTLQVVDEIYVPTTFGNTTDVLEPIAVSYPAFGKGGAKQYRVDKVVEFSEVEKIGK